MERIMVNGITYDSVYKFCSENKVSVYNYRQLLERGISMETYLDMRESLKFRGTQFEYLSKFCQKYKLDYAKAQRYFYQGYSLSQLYSGEYLAGLLPNNRVKFDETTRLTRKRDNIELNRIVYPRYYDICLLHNVAISIFKKRLEYGWSLEEAAELVPRGNYDKIKEKKEPKQRGAQSIEFRGKVFKSFVDACDYYKVPIRVSRLRKNAGESLEDIFINKPSKHVI